MSSFRGQRLRSTPMRGQSPATGQGYWQTVLLWSALILAVIVLAFLSLRMGRKDG